MSEQKDTLKEWLDKTTTLQKLLLTIGAIVVSIFGGMKWMSEQIKAHDEQVLSENADIFADKVLQILEEKGIATRSDLASTTDSITMLIEANAIADEQMHLRTLRMVDTTRILIEERGQFNARLELRIETIQSTLDSITGISRATREEQSMQAVTDSLQNELLRIKMESHYRDRMRQSEKQHLEELRRIRDLSRDIVIDKGRKKTIRRGGRQKKPTRKGERQGLDIW